MLLRGIVVLFVVVAGCAPINELNRPDPVDLSKITPGAKRIDVIAELGVPTATIQDSGNSCDVYQLYTHGPDAGAKAGIALVEGAADVFTLGLSEVLFTPIEAGTNSVKHTVLMCYGSDGLLNLVKESGTTMSGANRFK